MFKKKTERCCGFVALRRMNPQAARQPSQKTTIFLTSTLMQPQQTHTHTHTHWRLMGLKISMGWGGLTRQQAQIYDVFEETFIKQPLTRTHTLSLACLIGWFEENNWCDLLTAWLNDLIGCNNWGCFHLESQIRSQRDCWKCPLHQDIREVGKSCVFVRNKSIIKMFLTKIRVHNT